MEPTGGTSGTGTATGVARPPPARVFVALKIASDLAQELVGLSASLEGLAVRRVAAADIHLTLVPPWSEPSVSDAMAKLGVVAALHAPFKLAFWHVGYGPEPKRPRFLWAEGTASTDLEELRAALLAAFGQTDERPFLPHVTLARIRGNGAAIARKHPINRNLALSQQVVSVELMQSPPSGGAGYIVLASVPLAAAAPADESRI